MRKYLAIYHANNGTLGAYFPDFPGCIAVEYDLDELKISAKTALEFHIAGMKEDGEAIPEPMARAWDDGATEDAWKAFAGGNFFFVEVEA